jgi:hypothetical protein
MLDTPSPKTIEEALTLFPGVTASAAYFNKAWQFRVESERLFIYDETRRRRAWQSAFRDAWKMYRKHELSAWDVALARRKSCAAKNIPR